MWLESDTSQESDMWALAAILFELQAARALLPDTELRRGVHTHLVRDDISNRIGQMPEHWPQAQPGTKAPSLSANSCIARFDDCLSASFMQIVTVCKSMFNSNSCTGDQPPQHPIDASPPHKTPEETRNPPPPPSLPEQDETLHGWLRAIGDHHPWHKMSIQERQIALSGFYGRNYDGSIVDPHAGEHEGLDRGPPPPGPLSAEELEVLEDLLSQLLTWRREDRATAESTWGHRWLTKTYAPAEDGPILQHSYGGAGHELGGKVWI
jgi:hypothetical protein